VQVTQYEINNFCCKTIADKSEKKRNCENRQFIIIIIRFFHVFHSHIDAISLLHFVSYLSYFLSFLCFIDKCCSAHRRKSLKLSRKNNIMTNITNTMIFCVPVFVQCYLLLHSQDIHPNYVYDGFDEIFFSLIN
jgi:hypothetical protein